MRVLVFATDILPLPGLPSSGTAIRTFGLVSGLRAHGHEVTECVPRLAVEGLKQRHTGIDTATMATLESRAFDDRNQAELIYKHDPDIILCGHWPAMLLKDKPRQRLAIDLAGPHLLERHYHGDPNPEAAVSVKTSILASADILIVSGPSQAEYFKSFLDRAAAPYPEFVTITMPLPPVTPVRSRTDTGELRVLFAGVFLPWQDPTAAIETVIATLEKLGAGKLVFVGGPHPNYPVSSERHRKLLAKIQQHPRVEVHPMLPYEQFIQIMQGCDVALDLMEWNLERELAVTIRTTTYLWAGLGVIYNNYADLSELISRYDAGWTVAPEDGATLSGIVEELAANRSVATNKGENAQKLAQHEFAWDRAVAPLSDLMSRATKRYEIDLAFDPENSVIGPLPIKQRFICRSNGLAELLVRLDRADAKITAKLSCLGELVTKQNVIADLPGHWAKLSFEPHLESAGKEFLLEVETTEQGGIYGAPFVTYPLLPIESGRLKSIAIRTATIRESQ